MQNIKELINQKVKKFFYHKYKWLIDGFVIVPNKLILSKKINSTDKIVLLGILVHFFNKEFSFPSMRTLAKELNLSLPTVAKSIKNLEKEKILKVKKIKGKNSLYSIEYQFIEINFPEKKSIDNLEIFK